VPAISGQMTSIYVREVVRVGTALRDGANRVVLFVHGNGTPGEVAFDVPYRDYSWMQFLARAGFDVFAMDMTGYGRSTRPTAMNDPCNLASEQQLVLAPGHSEACTPSYGQEMTTIASDWNDIGAVVDHLLALRHVSQVSLVAWSLGGPRAGGYAAQHPEKVQKLVLLAPGYNERNAADKPPAQVPAAGAALNTQSRDDFTALWNRQVGCPAQYEQAAFDAIWSAMIESDPVGATWGSGVRRAPEVTRWGWNASVVAATRIPTLMVTGAHDKEVLPERVHDLYANLGATRKVLIDLACSSHYAMWEKNHLLLFQGSLEWLTKGTVNGMEQGIVRLGY
jgi:pimeloyl-ACP methyl ester carboxylesterase